MSAGALGVGLVIYQYLASMTVSDLDITAPVYQDIKCLSDWPLIYSGTGWFNREAWIDWGQATLNQKTYPDDHPCQFQGANGGGPGGPGGHKKSAGDTCDNFHVPVEGIYRSLGLGLGELSNANDEILNVFSVIFLWLGISLCYTLLWHDLSMCSITFKDKVLDLHGVYKNFYWLLWLFTRPTGFQAMRYLRRGDWGGKAGQLLCWTLMPVFIAWTFVYFMFVWWPLAALVLLINPVRLSRFAVLLNSALFFLYALAAAIFALVMLFGTDHRPQYSMTFESERYDPGQNQNVTCVCGCTYRIKEGKSWEFFVVAFGAAVTCLARGWGTLKGLRNANWATLLTVAFRVPLNMYPVVWTREDENGDYIEGEPIMHRDKDTPVQGELAFDPFALMDEQNDALETWCNIRPSKVYNRTIFAKKTCQELSESGITTDRAATNQLHSNLPGPRATDSSKGWGRKNIKDQDICCGFACVKYGAKNSDDEDEQEPATV